MPSLAVLAQLLQQLPGLTLEGLKDPGHPGQRRHFRGEGVPGSAGAGCGAGESSGRRGIARGPLSGAAQRVAGALAGRAIPEQAWSWILRCQSITAGELMRIGATAHA